VHVETLAVGPLGCNCAIIADLVAQRAIVVDPGGDFDAINARLTGLGVRVDAIVHTHTHFDHVGCTAELQRATGAAASIHEGDRPLYDLLAEQAVLFGVEAPVRADMDSALTDGLAIHAGAVELSVMHTPGHTFGSCSFIVGDAAHRLVLTGDTLFRGSIGRTDLGGIDQETILRSIESRLIPLGDDVVVIPGHGPTTTIGEERAHNRFLRRL